MSILWYLYTIFVVSVFTFCSICNGFNIFGVLYCIYFSQLIKYCSRGEAVGAIVEILVNIQNENKLRQIFVREDFNVAKILPHAIAKSLRAMLMAFQNNCIQYNAHVHYLQLNALARVAIACLMTRIREQMAATMLKSAATEATASASASAVPTVFESGTTIENVANRKNDTRLKTMTEQQKTEFETNNNGNENVNENRIKDSDNGGKSDGENRNDNNDVNDDCRRIPTYLCEAITALLENLQEIQLTALIYIEAKFIDKFVKEHLLQTHSIWMLLRFAGHCCERIECLLNQRRTTSLQWLERYELNVLFECLDALLGEKQIWLALNRIGGSQRIYSLAAHKRKTTSRTSIDDENAVDSHSVGMSLSLPLTKSEQNAIICRILLVTLRAMSMLIREGKSNGNTNSIQMDKRLLENETNSLPQRTLYCQGRNFENEAWLLLSYGPKAIYLAKLIELHSNAGTDSGRKKPRSWYNNGTLLDSFKYGHHSNYGINYIPMVCTDEYCKDRLSTNRIL